MSVIVEFSIDTEAFQLGRVLAGPPDMHLELERIVPTGNQVAPFVWAIGEDQEAFEETVRAHPAVEELRVLDRLGERALYRIAWTDEPRDLLEGIARTDAVVLEARGDHNWLFRLRFPGHDRLSAFHNYVIEQRIPLHVERTYTLTEATERGHRFGLSQAQREALVLALDRGYFATPRETNLDDLAAELGISPQAASQRIRRGNEQVLRKALLPSVTDM